MKQDRFCCDRCKATYNYNAKRKVFDREEQRYGSIGLINTDNNIYRVDLCDACMDEVLTLLQHPEMTVCPIEEESDD